MKMKCSEYIKTNNNERYNTIINIVLQIAKKPVIIKMIGKLMLLHED